MPGVRLDTQTGLKVLLYMIKAELARCMVIARQHADRLLDLNHASRQDTLDAAFISFGQEVVMELRELAA